MKFKVILILIDTSLSKRKRSSKIINEVVAIATKAHYLNEEETYESLAYPDRYWIDQFYTKGLIQGLNPLGYYGNEEYDDDEGEEWKSSNEVSKKRYGPYTKNSLSVFIQYTENKKLFNVFKDIAMHLDDEDFLFSYNLSLLHEESFFTAKISEYEYFEIKKKLRKKINLRSCLKKQLHKAKVHRVLRPLSQNQKTKRH